MAVGSEFVAFVGLRFAARFTRQIVDAQRSAYFSRFTSS